MTNVKAQSSNFETKVRLRLSFFSTLALASTLDFLNLSLNFDIYLTFGF